MNPTSLGLVIAIAIAVAGVWTLSRERAPPPTTVAGPPDLPADLVPPPMVEVVLPASFTPTEVMGERAFTTFCAACHGSNAAGLEGIAPPLVHRIYHPAHHSDEAFHIAARNGVRAHHWRFGNMPPIEGVTRAEVTTIIAFVRALQRANGIE